MASSAISLMINSLMIWELKVAKTPPFFMPLISSSAVMINAKGTIGRRKRLSLCGIAEKKKM